MFGTNARASDPMTLTQRLATYRPFVQAVKRLTEKPNNPILLEDALENANPAKLAKLPSSLGVPPGRDDFRRPIITAQSRLFTRTKAAIENAIAKGDYDYAARLTVLAHRLTFVSREFGFSPFVATSNQRTQLIELLESLFAVLPEHQRTVLRHAIASNELQGKPPYDIMSNDVRLLTLDLKTTGAESGRDPALARVAAEAMRRAIAGEDIGWYIDRISKWQQNNDRDRLWQMIASWQIMLKRYKLDKQHLAALLTN